MVKFYFIFITTNTFFWLIQVCLILKSDVATYFNWLLEKKKLKIGFSFRITEENTNPIYLKSELINIEETKRTSLLLFKIGYVNK